MYIITPCKQKGALQALPDKTLKLDFSKVKARLNKADYLIVKDTPVVLLVKEKKERYELAIYPSGKILLKNVNEQKAEKIVNKLSKIIT